MSVFKRGLSNSFVEALTDEYKRNDWWKKIVDDKALFIAIRNEYINVYYQGNSLLRLDYNKGKLSAKTHYKYLIKPNLKKNENCLIKTSDKMAFIPDGSKGVLDYYLTHNLSEIESIKKASTSYGGVEKEGIQKILNSNNNIIDLEIALTKKTEQNENDIEKYDQNSAKRIDFLAIQKSGNDSYELVFFEAKDYTNKELKAKGTNLPPVLKKQVPTYENLLTHYQNDIKESYKTVCQNLINLLPQNTFSKSVVDITNGANFDVNLEPRLVIFGFDDDQRRGTLFQERIEKLNDALGKNRVLLKGSPSEFVRGISYPK